MRRFIVVGGGVLGLLTARRLSAFGSVTLLENKTIGHAEAASYGSRLALVLWGKKALLPLMRESMPEWDELYRQHPRLIRRTACLELFPDISAAREAAELYGSFDVRMELRTAQDAANAYGLSVGPHDWALLQPESTYLIRTEDLLRTLAEELRAQGVEIRERMQVNEITEQNSTTSVRTSSGKQFEADSVVLTTGAWVPRLLENFGYEADITATGQLYHLFSPVGTGVKAERFEHAPGFIKDYRDGYFFAVRESDGTLKAVEDNIGPPTPPGESREDAQETSSVKEWVSRLEPNRWVYRETRLCRYTLASDYMPVIGTLPGMQSVVLVAPPPGGGVKTGPALAACGAALAVGDKPPLELSEFSIERLLPVKR